MSQFTRPVPLRDMHDLTVFGSGQPSLDAWLTGRAARNEESGASRTFVTTRENSPLVVGFYSLAASSVRLAAAPGAVRRNMPDPIPVILLGRLAVDKSCQGCGLGRALLQDATRRVLAAAETVGIRALMVDALDDDAARFYARFGFAPSPTDERTLFLPLARIRASVPS